MFHEYITINFQSHHCQCLFDFLDSYISLFLSNLLLPDAAVYGVGSFFSIVSGLINQSMEIKPSLSLCIIVFNCYASTHDHSIYVILLCPVSHLLCQHMRHFLSISNLISSYVIIDITLF